ncbi:MAG TPA: hypothetical protein VFB12_02860 [Ktedonobacteraceae bacterium]|nr:hypothetical protein [Ktedonobacteraceae bacterium]
MANTENQDQHRVEIPPGSEEANQNPLPQHVHRVDMGTGATPSPEEAVAQGNPDDRTAPPSEPRSMQPAMANHRDLGTVGGGPIPGNVAGKLGKEPARPVEDALQGQATPPTNQNAIDPTAQSNLGGRNPGQPQTAMGPGPDKPHGNNSGKQ